MNKQIHIRYSPSLETLCLILKAKIVIITCSCWISLERSFSGNPNTFNSIQLLYIFQLNGPLISSYKRPYSFDSWTVGKNCWVNRKKVFLFKSKFQKLHLRSFKHEMLSIDSKKCGGDGPSPKSTSKQSTSMGFSPNSLHNCSHCGYMANECIHYTWGLDPKTN